MTAFRWDDVRRCTWAVEGAEEAANDVEAAVAKRQNILLSGPPGILQAMIARRIPLLLDKLSAKQAVALGALYYRHNLEAEWKEGDVPPFRAPHHSVGIGAMWKGKYQTGEIGMAAWGVLYLDELGSFKPKTVRHTGEYVERERRLGVGPLVVASATPCPCGWMKSSVRKCVCPDAGILRHRSTITARCDTLSIDTIINVPSVSLVDMKAAARAENPA
jgi:magnesium chelatase family protein